jgi:ketosteroid isomerase-like protein
MQSTNRSPCLAAASLLAAAAMLFGCSSGQQSAAPSTEQSAEQIVNDITSKWLGAYNSGNLDALTDLYAEDASLHMPGAPAIWGRQAIRDYWREDMSGGAQTQLDVTSAYSAGNLTYVEGRYRVASADGMQLAAGDFVELWRQDPNGAWKIMNDNWHAHGVDYAPRAGNDLAVMLTSSWTDAYNSGDAARLAALYDENARLTMPGEATVTGRGEIETFWTDDIGSSDSATELDLRDAYVEGGLAHLEGAYRVTGKDGAVLATGEYLQLWVREENEWRIHREMWSRNPDSP